MHCPTYRKVSLKLFKIDIDMLKLIKKKKKYFFFFFSFWTNYDIYLFFLHPMCFPVVQIDIFIVMITLTGDITIIPVFIARVPSENSIYRSI